LKIKDIYDRFKKENADMRKSSYANSKISKFYVNSIKLITLMLVAEILFAHFSCRRLDRFNANGLKDYFIGFLNRDRIKLVEIECKMHPAHSRAGYCLFEVNEADFKKMQRILNLKEVIIEADTNGYYHSPLFSELQIVKFEFMNSSYDLNDVNSWHQFPLRESVKVFKADPPLPPLRGNEKSSFKFLIYNKNTYKLCVFLEYPYG